MCAARTLGPAHPSVLMCERLLHSLCDQKTNQKKKTKQQSGHVHYRELSATCNCGEATLWPIRHVCCGNGSQLLYPNQARGRALLLPLSPTQSQMTQSVTNKSLTTRPPQKKKKLMGCTYTRLCPGPNELYNGLSVASLHTLAAAALDPPKALGKIRVCHMDSKSWGSTW